MVGSFLLSTSAIILLESYFWLSGFNMGSVKNHLDLESHISGRSGKAFTMKIPSHEE
jgi:hypothetical protein